MPRYAAPRRPASAFWIYGRHAGLAAIANPRRQIVRIVGTSETAGPLEEAISAVGSARPTIDVLDRKDISRLLPPGAVHQGFAVLAKPLPPVTLDDLCDTVEKQPRAAVLVLDQAADPQNVGAIVRSAAAFASSAVLIQDRNAPTATGALTKAASGAMEIVPLVTVTNIARALRALQRAGLIVIGLAGEANSNIADVLDAHRVAIVLGSEESGLRRLVRDQCDHLASIRISPETESLNVSVAAAIALYEWSRTVDQ